jgi:glycosyltransferase involved in cell wall biosynthesis
MTRARRWAASRVIMVSDVARERYLSEGRDRPGHLVVVRNGVLGRPEVGEGSRVRGELGLPEDAIVISMISALRPEKAHDIAIEAVRRLRERDPRVHLLVAGTGPEAEAIQRAAAPLGDGVRLLGYRSDVMALLDATDVLLHPAHFDALPTTLIEAAAASVPVVATRVGGIPEIVEDGRTGVLVDGPPQPERLVDALCELLPDADRRAQLGAAARERFEREFSADAWARRLRTVYEDVLRVA